MSGDESEPSGTTSGDPLYVNAKRESAVLLAAFAVILVWSISVSYWLGYDVATADISLTVWGMPRWVFWGIAVPWIASNIFTVVFCLFYMADDHLGDLADEDAS